MQTVAIVALTFSTAVAGAQGVKQQGASTAAARTAINHAWDEVVAAAKAGDASALAKIYTPDAMMIDPSMPTVTGRANIEKTLKDWLATTKFIGMTRQQTAFETLGDVAIENGTFTQDVQEKGKPPMKVTGRYTLVWKQVDGKWLAHRDVSTPMPPAPAKK
jgi:uncharacterized protein (TIGR02246 family)